MADEEATVSRRRQISPIWLVPGIAVLLGIWMVYWTWANQGPEITITFATAADIEAGTTRIKARNVDVGGVERVDLGADLESVVVTARIVPGAARLLREDTQFWVERFRVGPTGVSGLDTLVSGGFIQLSPGTGEPGRREFEGLEEIPVTPLGKPGLRFTLVSDRAGSVDAGDPILYKGFQVGRVESARFDVDTQQVLHSAFIDAPYDELVTTSTRFWEASGFSFSATVEGIDLQTGSLRSLLLGGITFGLPEGMEPGGRVADDSSFLLFPDWQSVNDRPYIHSIEYVVEIEGSVRGLVPGAPVEYRGLTCGRVERLLLEELVGGIGDEDEGEGRPIPVLLRLEPGRLRFDDSPEGMSRLERAIEGGVSNGLRATLTTGNLLTGSRFVSLDIYDDVAPAKIGSFDGRPTIPTIPSGLEGIEQKVTQLLDNLNAIPLDDVAGNANATLRELNDTVAELRALIASDAVRRLPESLEASLAELERTLESFNDLATAIEDRPSSLIFSTDPAPDPEPQAGQP